MISLNEMSNNLTRIITKDLEVNEEKQEIITYAIETLLLAIIGILLLIIFASILGVVKGALAAAAFGVVLRKFSGGAHFSTPGKCLVFGAVVYSALGVVAQKVVDYHLVSDFILWICLVIALIIVSIFAPVDSESKPIHSISLKKKLRGFSIAFVFIAIVISIISSNSLLNVSMCLGVLYQSLTLLPIFNRRGGG